MAAYQNLVSGQLQLRAAFSRPVGVRLGELPLYPSMKKNANEYVGDHIFELQRKVLLLHKLCIYCDDHRCLDIFIRSPNRYDLSYIHLYIFIARHTLSYPGLVGTDLDRIFSVPDKQPESNKCKLY